MTRQRPALGIDFGTSNTSAGYMSDTGPVLVEMSSGKTGLPTTFFFDFDSRATLIGEAANQALLDGIEGRFMRALKRVLGTTLMHERRQILNERVTFVEIVARFLRHVKTRAEAQSGLTFDRVLSGRPVVFHGEGDPREAQALDDLRACYHAAGFTQVDFMAEPEAAAIASGASGQSPGLGLVVDIGGGTSDFSLFGADAGGIDILANHGIRIGGTDFDRAISIDHVMPLLGRGSDLRNAMGPGVMTAPNAIFNDLATWEKIPFLYTQQVRRAVDDMAKMAEAPARLARLQTTLRDELGHDIAFAVEAGKIAANTGATDARIGLAEIERGLGLPLSNTDLTASLAPFADDLRRGAAETLAMAGRDARDVDRIVYVGGSSRMAMVSGTMAALFPQARHSFSAVFTAVAEGLAIAAARP